MLRPCLCAMALFALAGCAQSSFKVVSLEEDEERETTGGVESVAMRRQQRQLADGTLPLNALWKAKLRRDEMARLAGQGSGGTDGVWNWIGPGNIGGRLRSMCIHPTNPSTMWVGAATGGVWKTTDGGASWSALPDFVPSLSVGSMVLSPSDPNTLYVGTGEGCFETDVGSSNTAAVPGAGIFKSTDGGQTWAQIPSTATGDWVFVNRLAFQPGSSVVMLAATNTGVWRSTDAGTTWSQRTVGQTLDVEFDPANGLKALAGRNDGTGQYSLDGGVTWQTATGIAAGSTRVELTYAPSNTGIVYAGVSTGAAMKIYQSTNGGQSYVLKTTSPGAGVSTLDSYTGVVWVDPVNPNTLLLGTQGLYRSTNAGATLTSTFSAVHSDHHYIVPHPLYNGTTNKTLYFCGDGGIYRTTDSAGSAATSLNNNLGVTQFYGAAINDSSGIVVGGAQDNYTLRYSGNPGAWTAVIGGDGGFAASDPTNPNYFYGGYQRFGLNRSSNGGNNWSLINSGLGDAGSLNCNFIPYFMLDPNDPNRMLAGGRSLWRANNVRTGSPPAWTAIKPPISLFAPPPANGRRQPALDHFAPNDPRNISTIAVAAGNADIIWVGHNNGQVYRTSNGTSAVPAWTRVDLGTPGLPARWISRIVIDPANHSRVYLSAMGYAPDNLWRTTDNGATWQNISGAGPGALPEIAVSAISLHPAGGRLFAGTDVGLFASSNDGATWAPAAPELGPVEIAELVWRNSTTLMVVTHGRGIYLGVPAAPVCYANCDGSTVAPVLNINDFICFQTRFAAGDPYANCDNSTVAPILNVNDFICFQTNYAQGCP